MKIFDFLGGFGLQESVPSETLSNNVCDKFVTICVIK